MEGISVRLLLSFGYEDGDLIEEAWVLSQVNHGVINVLHWNSARRRSRKSCCQSHLRIIELKGMPLQTINAWHLSKLPLELCAYVELFSI